MTTDMRPEAVERRMRRQGQLTRLCLGLAGPRRRPVSHFGPLTPLDENGEPIGEPMMLQETPPPCRASTDP
jgi:hypothetical protein